MQVRRRSQQGSCADMESPQICGNSREWLWYLFLLPKELGICERHQHIPHSPDKPQARCVHSISSGWFMEEFERKSQQFCLFNSGAPFKKLNKSYVFLQRLSSDQATSRLKVKIRRRPGGSIRNRLLSRWRIPFWFKHLTDISRTLLQLWSKAMIWVAWKCIVCNQYGAGM